MLSDDCQEALKKALDNWVNKKISLPYLCPYRNVKFCLKNTTSNLMERSRKKLHGLSLIPNLHLHNMCIWGPT